MKINISKIIMMLVSSLVVYSFSAAFQPETAFSATRLGAMDFDSNFTCDYNYLNTQNSNFGTFVNGFSGNAFRSSHAGDDGSGNDDFTVQFPSNYWPPTNELYIRFYYKFEPQYTNISSNVKWLWTYGSDYHNELIVSSLSSTGVGFRWQLSGGGAGWSSGVTKYGSASVQQGEWMLVEIYFKLSTGANHLNPDGIQYIKINGQNVIYETNVKTGVPGTMYSPAINATTNQPSGHGWWQIDAYEVWDEMPGSDQGSQDSYPTIQIAMPTSNSNFTVSTQTIELGGTASDDIGLSQVTWANNQGGQGSVSGSLTSWNVSNIALVEGENTITVSAIDISGQTSSDAIIINYLPNAESPPWTANNQTGNSAWTDSGVTWCVRLLVEGNSIINASDGIKLAFQGRNSGSYTIRKVSIAEKDPNGSEGDVINSTWMRVSFDGNDAANWETDLTSVPAGVEKISDPLSFPIDPSKDYYVTYTLESPSAYLVAPSYYREMYFDNADHASDVDWSGIDYQVYDARLHALSSIYPAEGGDNLLAIPGTPTNPQILMD